MLRAWLRVTPLSVFGLIYAAAHVHEAPWCWLAVAYWTLPILRLAAIAQRDVPPGGA